MEKVVYIVFEKNGDHEPYIRGIYQNEENAEDKLDKLKEAYPWLENFDDIFFIFEYYLDDQTES